MQTKKSVYGDEQGVKDLVAAIACHAMIMTRHVDWWQSRDIDMVVENALNVSEQFIETRRNRIDEDGSRKD
jgi:hypothetical protein